eukprot:787170-Amphidinium_carterae.1
MFDVSCIGGWARGGGRVLIGGLGAIRHVSCTCEWLNPTFVMAAACLTREWSIAFPPLRYTPLGLLLVDAAVLSSGNMDATWLFDCWRLGSMKRGGLIRQ